MSRRQMFGPAFVCLCAVVMASCAGGPGHRQSGTRQVSSGASPQLPSESGPERSVLERYLTNPTILAILASRAEEWNDHLDLSIETSAPTHVTPIILQQPEWEEGSDHPFRGRWIIRYSVEGAPARLWYNVAFRAVQGYPPAHRAMPLGETLVTRELFDDIIRDVLRATRFKLEQEGQEVRLDAAGPWKAVVAYTELLNPPRRDGDGAVTGAWQERWTVRMNRIDNPVLLDFVPDGNGGTKVLITVEPNKEAADSSDFPPFETS